VIYFGYVVFNIIFAIALMAFILKMYKGTPYFYTQFLNIYAFLVVLISLLVLEYGVYITESLNYSYLNGATSAFLLFFFCFFLGLKFFIKALTSIKFTCFKQKKRSFSQQKYLAVLVSILCFLFLFSLFINLVLSPIPIFSENVNRLNFWEHARFPFFKLILGERSIPIAIGLGVVFNFYRLHDLRVLKKITLLTFIFYIIYLLMLGHKFSPLMLALFFFFVPTMIVEKPPLKLLLKYAFFGFITGISYVLYTYSSIDTGIVSEYGGALGGALYRIFVLQGHVFWNMFNQLEMLRDGSWESLLWLVINDFDGLMLAMYTVSPDLAEGYLASGVRFTAGFPGFLLATPLLFSFMFITLVLFIYSVIVVRLVVLASSGSIARLSIYIFMLYFFHFGFTMGDFRFLFSFKFFLFLYLLLLVEVALLSLGSSQSKSRKPSLVVVGNQQHNK